MEQFKVILFFFSLSINFYSLTDYLSKLHIELKGAMSNYVVQYLAGHTMRTERAKSQRWINLPQQRHHVQMLDPTPRIWIVLTPQPDELIQMMRPQNGPIPCQIIKIVHDDRHK